MRVIRSQVTRMRRLVEDLLDVSRIDRRGGVSIEPEPLDLADEMREAAARTEREHPAAPGDRRGAGDAADRPPTGIGSDRC